MQEAAIGKLGAPYPQFALEAKRKTTIWENSTRKCASLGFYNGDEVFETWAGRRLQSKSWEKSRPWLHQSIRFQTMVGGMSFDEYSANKSIVRGITRERKLGQEVKVLKKKLKTADSWTPINTRTPNINEVKTISKGTLYVMESMLNEDIYKVGSTYIGRWEKRLSELQTATPMRCIYKLDIDCDPSGVEYGISVKEFERAVHKELEAYNLMNEADLAPFVGRELFRCSPIIVLDAIKHVADATGVEVK